MDKKVIKAETVLNLENLVKVAEEVVEPASIVDKKVIKAETVLNLENLVKVAEAEGRACFNCGEEGHQSRDCPEPRKPREGGGGGGRACFNCGEEGHQSRECP